MTATADSTAMTVRPEGEPAKTMATVPSPVYMQGFDGMATEPFPEAARKVLAEPVDPAAVEIKPDGIVYVPGVYYRRQLTRAFGAGAWAIVPRQPARVMGDVVIYPGALYILGRFVSESVGECTYRQNSNMSYASCVEGAKTDALSRCCKDLGMSTELWDPAWRKRWQEDYAEEYWGEQKNYKTGQTEKKKKWRLRSGRPVQEINLMAGAGGVVSPSPSPPPAASPAPAPSDDDVPPPTDADAPPVDTGEAASEAQLEAIVGQFKRLTWKQGQAKMWIKVHFGIAGYAALSQQQADDAFLLLNAIDKPALFSKLIDSMVTAGRVRKPGAP